MFVTLRVSKLDRFTEPIYEHSLNIEAIVVTFSVLKLDRSSVASSVATEWIVVKEVTDAKEVSVMTVTEDVTVEVATVEVAAATVTVEVAAVVADEDKK